MSSAFQKVTIPPMDEYDNKLISSVHPPNWFILQQARSLRSRCHW
ncbi:hypothetical protein [Gloeocapsopsis sp. IPPAS B-1203]|nr:hypothetical protein [Gloeocapsopsis sp. IPPAS B-1203]